MAKDSIYVIMTMGKLEMTELGWPELGMTRVVGYYNDKDDARKCVTENWGDLWETCYNYAVIEKVKEGIYGSTQEREFFKYDKESRTYKPYAEPLFMCKIAGLTMG